jgi:YesN/AraC family two-component response regulator
MKVLVVEDEPLIRIGLASLVEEAGYTVLEASNASEAIKQIELDPAVRIVITDVDMPGSMDGIRLAHFVRDRWPPIQLIVISGKVDVSLGQLPNGARFFTKPAPETVLLAAMRELAGPEART